MAHGSAPGSPPGVFKLRHVIAWSPAIFANLVFRQLFDAASSTYTYLLGDARTREAVIIDTVFEQHLRDHALLGELDLKLVAVIDTHCHADHVTGAWMMQRATGCRIGISRRYQPPIQGVDLPLDHGDRIAFGGRHLEVRATPGHTDGCLTLVLDDQEHGLHRRRAADPRGGPLRLPARQCPRPVSLDHPGDLFAARRVPAVSGP